MSLNARFSSEAERVWWLVPANAANISGVPNAPGAPLRHALTTSPYAYPAMTLVTAVCGMAVKVPVCSPYGKEPPMRHVAARCAECRSIVALKHCVEEVVDL